MNVHKYMGYLLPSWTAVLSSLSLSVLTVCNSLKYQAVNNISQYLLCEILTENARGWTWNHLHAVHVLCHWAISQWWLPHWYILLKFVQHVVYLSWAVIMSQGERIVLPVTVLDECYSITYDFYLQTLCLGLPHVTCHILLPFCCFFLGPLQKVFSLTTIIRR